MASSAPKNQIGQGRDRAKLLLDLNNSAISNTSDKLFSALEAGEGSLYLRQSIDTVLHQLAA